MFYVENFEDFFTIDIWIYMYIGRPRFQTIVEIIFEGIKVKILKAVNLLKSGVPLIYKSKIKYDYP